MLILSRARQHERAPRCLCELTLSARLKGALILSMVGNLLSLCFSFLIFKGRRTSTFPSLAITDCGCLLLESWLVETSILFPNIKKVTDVCEHIVYGSQTQIGQRYVDLKRMKCAQDGRDIYGKADTLENHPPYGTFYVKSLRVDRSLMDWDRILDRHMYCSCGEL